MTERDIFLEALQKSDCATRLDYLNQACGGDEQLRKRVEGMLQLLGQAGELLGSQTGSSKKPFAVEEAGTNIGPYKLVRKLDEGGMGTVWIAEQTEPVKRRVALKLIKPGMDSRQIIRRFEQERQALAVMDHANIAKVLDAGTTDTGRPYFVMELVNGVPITRYCDDMRLSLSERLALFVPVCQAIQHAHQKGIIHRDIKPSNVLVAMQDGQPTPKVIDFGLAKALHEPLTEQSIHTDIGLIAGTLDYMSPEQAKWSALDIDTRADVYSLGALLYELLTGTTPLDRQHRKLPVLELLHLIRETEPPKPSTRLRESMEPLTAGAELRRIEPARWIKAVRGELDWIVMKCLEKDRTRRYETANALARDIQRYLSYEPVEAGPPSARYRLSKFTRRYRAALATAAAFVLLLATAAGISSWQAVRATRAETEARTAAAEATEQRNEASVERDHAVRAEGEAKRSQADSQAVLEYFRDKVLSAGRPLGQEGGLGRKVTLREAVDAAERQIADSFKNQPLVEASIRDTLGLTYSYLGELSLAIKQLEQGLALRQSKLGVDHLDTLTSRNNLAKVLLSAGRIPEAMRLHELDLKICESKFGPDHPRTLNVRGSVASAYWDAGRTAEAVRRYEEILPRMEAKLGIDHPDTLLAVDNLAFAYISFGRCAEAIRLLERSLHQREKRLGADHPNTLTVRHNLASAFYGAGRIAESISMHELNLRKREEHLGIDHPDTLTSRNNLADAYHAAGRLSESIQLHLQNLKLSEAKLGPNHPRTLSTRNNLAAVYVDAGRTDDAIALHEQTLKEREAESGADHPDTLISRSNLAMTYATAGRSSEAIHLNEENLRLCEAKLGSDHPTTMIARNNLADAYQSVGRTGDAIRLNEQNLKLRRAKFGDDHPDTLFSRNNLAQAYWQVGRNSEALPLHEQNVKLSRAKLGPDHPDTLKFQNNLAGSLWSAGRTAEAIGMHEQNLKARQAKLGADHPDTLLSMANLSACYRDTGRLKEAISLLETTLQRGRKRPGGMPASLAWVEGAMAQTYEQAKQFAKAEPIYRDSLKQSQKLFGSDDPRTAGAMALLGANLLKQHKFPDAESVLRKCLAIREKKLPEAWNTFNTRSALGEALAGQKKFAEAEPLLVKGYEGMKQREDKIPPAAHKLRLTEARQRLVHLYDAWGKKDEAVKWRKETPEPQP